MDGPLTNVVGEKEYSPRLQYTKYFPEFHPYLFFREVNGSVESYDTGYGFVFKFEIKNISLLEMYPRVSSSCLFQNFFGQIQS